MISKLIDESAISVYKEGSYISCVLTEEDMFSQVGYKVVKSQDNDMFIQSAKVRHNGKIKLIYAIGGCQSLSEMISESAILKIWDMLFKVSDGIIQIRNNGFLSCENLLTTFDTIFFNLETMMPHFIYVPLVCGDVENANHDFDDLFRKQLKSAIENNTKISLEEKSIVEQLCKGTSTMEEIRTIAYSHVGTVCGTSSGVHSEKRNSISLISLDPQVPLRFLVSENRFTIGRRKDNDGVVDFSKQISRLHCSVKYVNGKFGIIDENSKYGTEINQTRCIPGRFYELQEGDIIKLPVISFKVQR